MRLLHWFLCWWLLRVGRTKGEGSNGSEEHVPNAIDEARWKRYKCDGTERQNAQSCAREGETFSTWLTRQMGNETYEKLACYVDKSAVKYYVKTVVPEMKVPTTLAVFEEANLHELSKFAFPSTFALKAVHGSGMGILATNNVVYEGNVGSLHPNQTINPAVLHDSTRLWLNTSYKVDQEWQYRHIQKAVILEEFLGAVLPINLKVFLFQSKAIALDICRFVPISGALGNVRERVSRIKQTGSKPLTTPFARSRVWKNSKTMIGAKLLEDIFNFSARIASGFRFARVDFYVVDSTIYFNKITLSPETGKKKLDIHFTHLDMRLLGMC